MNALNNMMKMTVFQLAYDSLASGHDDTSKFDYGLLTGFISAAYNYGKISTEEYEELNCIIDRLFDLYL